jgi:UDP-N-acetylglucosamine diphosphorylase / glucose-1-phosphate thymidylyltransferase / UDP-N-acetylgalactosamine diphosphorylase / glucosamine-1-phosphate N-acetyltransferase / galactosamine-1-phosphate N-acetyltransferase
MEFLKAEEFFDLSLFAHRGLFSGCSCVWEALGRVSAYLGEHLRPNVGEVGCFGRPLPGTLVLWKGELFKDDFEIVGGDVTKGKFRVKIRGEETNEASVLFEGSILWDDAIFIGPGAVLEPGALIKGPTIIGARTEVRQGAYVRGKCIVGDRCVVGHTTEMKSSIMLDGAKAGHFAYIGDSILGNDTNLGAGTKLANLKMKEANVRVLARGSCIDTGLRKLGAILGDHVEIGCNAVTNPGAILGKACLVYPVTAVNPGYYEPNTVIKR